MADTLIKLSGSTDGRAIKVTQTATAGNTIHTAHATALDIVTLWAVNVDASLTLTLTLEWGNASTDDNIIVAIPPKAGPVMVCDRLPITNSLVVKAFADVANNLRLFGLVVRSA